jgi:hypothetical protein
MTHVTDHSAYSASDLGNHLSGSLPSGAKAPELLFLRFMVNTSGTHFKYVATMITKAEFPVGCPRIDAWTFYGSLNHFNALMGQTTHKSTRMDLVLDSLPVVMRSFFETGGYARAGSCKSFRREGPYTNSAYAKDVMGAIDYCDDYLLKKAKHGYAEPVAVLTAKHPARSVLECLDGLNSSCVLESLVAPPAALPATVTDSASVWTKAATAMGKSLSHSALEKVAKPAVPESNKKAPPPPPPTPEQLAEMVSKPRRRITTIFPTNP